MSQKAQLICSKCVGILSKIQTWNKAEMCMTGIEPLTVVVVVLVAEPLGELLLAGLLRVQVQPVQHCQRLLGVPVLKTSNF
jgi:hypothetical protein